MRTACPKDKLKLIFFFKACRFGIRIFRRVFVKFRTISYLKKYHCRVFRSVDN